MSVELQETDSRKTTRPPFDGSKGVVANFIGIHFSPTKTGKNAAGMVAKSTENLSIHAPSMQKRKLKTDENPLKPANGAGAAVPSHMSPTSNGAAGTFVSKKRKSEDDPTDVHESSNRKNKGKKGKRFLWTDELPRRFVAAVFDGNDVR